MSETEIESDNGEGDNETVVETEVENDNGEGDNETVVETEVESDNGEGDNETVVGTEVENECEECDTDDTLSKLNMNDISPTSYRNKEYDDVVEYVQREEKKLMIDLKRNQLLIPDDNKKKRCDLQIDKKAYDYFTKTSPLNCYFKQYVSQRRDSKQIIETILTHCCQFISFVKLKNNKYKGNVFDDLTILLNNICKKSPILCHQYFDYMRNINLQASTIITRIDSIILLFEWLRLNSNNIHIYNDVSNRYYIDCIQIIHFL